MEEHNKVKGVVLKYSEPPEARMPTERWRLYIFKGDEELGKMDLDVITFFHQVVVLL